MKIAQSKAFVRSLSFVAGTPLSTGFSLFSKLEKVRPTGGWRSAQFRDGEPADATVRKTCSACHQAVPARDFVFTRYAP